MVRLARDRLIDGVCGAHDAGVVAAVRWKPDEVDLWCQQWALQRRKMLGLTDLSPNDRLGKLNSTLGAVRDDAEGASQGTPAQNFPEVYTGMALLVHRAVSEMQPKWARVLSLHFVHRERPTKWKAHQAGCEISAYWKTLTYAKNYVHSFVTVSTKYDAGEPKGVATQMAL